MNRQIIFTICGAAIGGICGPIITCFIKKAFFRHESKNKQKSIEQPAMGDVSSEVYEDVLGESIRLKDCKKCGSPNREISVLLPTFGKTGAVVRCRDCGASTKLCGVWHFINCGGKFATPITLLSVSNGIRKAIKEWNA